MNSFGVDVNWLRRLKGGWKNSLEPTFLAEVKISIIGVFTGRTANCRLPNPWNLNFILENESN